MDKKFDLCFPAGKSSHIAVYDNLIPQEICRKFINYFETYEQFTHEGKTNGGVLPHVKCSTDLRYHSSEVDGNWSNEMSELDFETHSYLTLAFADYQQHYEQTWVPYLFGDTGYQIQKYAKGQGFYRTHVDATPWDENGRDRFLAFVIYLNTVEHGGGTNFTIHDLTVDAKVGRVCIFPSSWTHPHRGLVPYSEDKYIISTFIVPGPLMNGMKLSENGNVQMADNHHDHNHPDEHHQHDHVTLTDPVDEQNKNVF